MIGDLDESESLSLPLALFLTLNGSIQAFASGCITRVTIKDLAKYACCIRVVASPTILLGETNVSGEIA